MLLDYLHGYAQRVRPLLDLGREMEVVRAAAGTQFDAGGFPGWQVGGKTLLSLSAGLCCVRIG